MTISTYKDLLFWQKSYQSTTLILELIRDLSRDYATDVIVKQLIRASTSVGANIAEGYGRYVGKEFSRFLTTSLGSAVEVDYWLLLLRDLHPKLKNQINTISLLNDEVVRMIASTIKTLNNKSK